MCRLCPINSWRTTDDTCALSWELALFFPRQGQAHHTVVPMLQPGLSSGKPAHYLSLRGSPPFLPCAPRREELAHGLDREGVGIGCVFSFLLAFMSFSLTLGKREGAHILASRILDLQITVSCPINIVSVFFILLLSRPFPCPFLSHTSVP